MICSHVYDFFGGTKIALPHPRAEQLVEHPQWDIVRPNESAEQVVRRHLATLKALESRKGRTI
jgi:hypothetical protein